MPITKTEVINALAEDAALEGFDIVEVLALGTAAKLQAVTLIKQLEADPNTPGAVSFLTYLRQAGMKLDAMLHTVLEHAGPEAANLRQMADAIDRTCFEMLEKRSVPDILRSLDHSLTKAATAFGN
jgi:hypothetical protein